MEKEELRKLYYSMSNKELCEMLGVSHMTLIATLKRKGIPLKGKGNREKKRKL